jgi:putative flippase GtrA
METRKRIVVLIPAYKPGEALVRLCRQLVSMGFMVAVINDGSGIEYNYYFSMLPTEALVLNHTTNRGKGRALKTGLEYIHRHFPSIAGVITADADGQHLLEDIMKVSKEVEEHEASLILGCRRFDGKVPLRSRLGNLLTRWIFAASSGKMVTDTQTGLRGIPYRLIPEMLMIEGDRYEYEMNMLLSAAKGKTGIREVPIRTVYIRGNESSHFRAVRDSLMIYGRILKFGLSSLVSFALDFTLLLILRQLTSSLDPSLSLLVSAAGARAASSVFNFMLNRRLVFKSKASAAPEAMRYFTLAGSILIANYGLLYLFNIMFGINIVASKVVTELLLYAASYRVQRNLVFREEKDIKAKMDAAITGRLK